MDNHYISMFPSSSFGFNHHHRSNEDGTTIISSANSIENNHFPPIMMIEDEKEFSRKLNIYFNHGISISLVLTFFNCKRKKFVLKLSIRIESILN